MNWLELCIASYYDVNSSDLSALDHYNLYRLVVLFIYSLHLYNNINLYRHMLGLSLPYDYSPPTMTETLSPENRRKQLAPLWLCYWWDDDGFYFHYLITLHCSLLVELSLSPDDSDEAFESAIHSLSENNVGLELLWWSYLMVKMKAACKKSATVQSVKVN